MSYADDLNYQTWLLIAAVRGDQQTGARAYETAWDSGIDPIHIAQHLAAIVAAAIPPETVDEQLAVAAAAAAANFPETGPPIVEPPRGSEP